MNPHQIKAKVNLMPLAVTICRQCNGRFGAGRHHFASCAEHKNQSWHQSNDRAALALQVSTQDKVGAL